MAEFPKFLGIAMETFLLLCDDKESDVRMAADECLNRTIKVGCFDLSVQKRCRPYWCWNQNIPGFRPWSSSGGLRELTHWPLGDLNVILKNVIYNLALLIGIYESSYDNVLRWMPQDLTDDKSNIGSGHGLVPSGSKPLPEPVLTRIQCHMVSLGPIELISYMNILMCT